MVKDKVITYKTLKKLSRTKDELLVNFSTVKQSQLEDKLYKQLHELADEIADVMQYGINHRGDDSDGDSERQAFIQAIKESGVRWNTTQKDNLTRYVDKLISNLKR